MSHAGHGGGKFSIALGLNGAVVKFVIGKSKENGDSRGQVDLARVSRAKWNAEDGDWK